MIDHEIQSGRLVLGKVPQVVGTVSSAEFLRNFSPKSAQASCDVLEVRLDHIAGVPWPCICDSIEKSGLPTVLTVRLQNEGGNWKAADADRIPIYEEALDHVSMIDVELRSQIARKMTRLAKEKNKIALISYHDFAKTPNLSELKNIVREAKEFAQVFKISTMVQSESDIEALRLLLDEHWSIPICVIGMGPLGTRTRVEFPKLGSCLTYGYLDKPSAPGQLSAAELSVQLKSFAPAQL